MMSCCLGSRAVQVAALLAQPALVPAPIESCRLGCWRLGLRPAFPTVVSGAVQLCGVSDCSCT